METNIIYHKDCMEVLKSLPDKGIDLVLTDPPYGIKVAQNGFVGGNNLGRARDYGAAEWDAEIPPKEYFDEIKRVSKNQIVFGGNYYLQHLGATSCFIVWDKENSGNFADCELAWTSFSSAIRIFRHRWNGMIRGYCSVSKEPRFHPTQKPLQLGLWILRNYAKEGQIILDTHAGSGTFLLAAKQLGMQYIGCEIKEEYIQIINQRLSQRTLRGLETELPLTPSAELRG